MIFMYVYQWTAMCIVVTIPARRATAVLSISLINDDILEGNEFLFLTINSFYSDIVESHQYQTKVTIIDTTGKLQVASMYVHHDSWYTGNIKCLWLLSGYAKSQDFCLFEPDEITNISSKKGSLLVINNVHGRFGISAHQTRL